MTRYQGAGSSKLDPETRREAMAISAEPIAEVNFSNSSIGIVRSASIKRIGSNFEARTPALIAAPLP